MVNSAISGIIDWIKIVVFARVNTNRQVIKRHLQNVGSHFFRVIIIISERLHICKHHKLVILVLKFNPLLKRAHIMP